MGVLQVNTLDLMKMRAEFCKQSNDFDCIVLKETRFLENAKAESWYPQNHNRLGNRENSEVEDGF